MGESLALETSTSLALKYADNEEVTREEEINLLEEMITDDRCQFWSQKKDHRRLAPPIPGESLPNPNPPPSKPTSSNYLTPPLVTSSAPTLQQYGVILSSGPEKPGRGL